MSTNYKYIHKIISQELYSYEFKFQELVVLEFLSLAL